MADTKVSALAAVTSVAQADLAYIVQGGVSKQATAAQLASANSGLASLNASDITATRALTAADFATGIIRLNAAGVIAITVPTVAAMSLPATAGYLRCIAFIVLGGGIPTFAGATSSTSINGTAGTTTVLPGSSGGSGGVAPVTYQVVILMQTAVGADTWTLQ